MSSAVPLPTLTIGHTIREAIRAIDEGRKCIALIVDDSGRLIGTITDGDIRRAIIAGTPLDEPVAVIYQRQFVDQGRRPVSAPQGTSARELIARMKQGGVRQIPIVDDAGRPVALHTIDELEAERTPPIRAMIMAGGFGKRLRPPTDEIPKPMLPVGDRPLIERVVEQLRDAGIREVNISTHYLPEKIVEHFGDGRRFGVEVRYVTEERPLGTAGALGLLEDDDAPVLMLNGDVLTAVDFAALFDYHREHSAAVTVGVRKYELVVPYGVVRHDGPELIGIEEKPKYEFFVNAGIYLVAPEAMRLVPRAQRFDMPDLIRQLIDRGSRVVSFPIHEYWMDIGQLEDYQRAQEDVRSGQIVSRAA